MAEYFKFKKEVMPVEVILVGDNVLDGIGRLVDKANIEGRPVCQQVSGIFVIVTPGADPRHVYKVWKYASDNPGVLHVVTPESKIERSVIVQNIERINRKIDELSDQLQEIQSKKQELVRENALRAMPREIEFSSEEARQYWDKLQEENSGDYLSKQTLKSADEWMRLMQKWMEQGVPLTYEMAEKALRITDTVRHSGASFSWTLQQVAKVWKYGKELKQVYEEEFSRWEKQGV